MLFRLADALRARLQHDLGRTGEDLAHRFLRRKQYTIVARNYRPASGSPGEIDLIAWHQGTLIFVEVKTRSSDRTGFPERAVDDAKQALLLRTARDYARRTSLEWTSVRFDVISITGDKHPVIEHFPNAFGDDFPITPPSALTID